jgi:membrane protease YdiL (CAAX protease family)
VTGRLAGWLALVLGLAALNYSSRLAGDIEPADDFFFRWETFAAGVVQLTIMAAILLLIVRGAARQLLALRLPSSWGRAWGTTAIVLVGTLVVGAVLNPVLQPGEEQGFVPDEWDPSRAEAFAANLVLTTLLVPVVEELVFRGAGYSLLARHGRAVAIAGTAILFGLAHGLVLALPVLVAFGLGLAWIRSRADSVFPCIVLHGLFNAAAVLLGVFTDFEGG